MRSGRRLHLPYIRQIRSLEPCSKIGKPEIICQQGGVELRVGEGCQRAGPYLRDCFWLARLSIQSH